MEAIIFFRRYLSDLVNFQKTGIVLLLAVFLLSIYVLFANKKRNLPPGPIGLPFFGYWPFVGEEPHKTFKRLAKKYGNLFGIYLGRTYTVVCNDWITVKEVLSKTETLNRPPNSFSQIPSGIGFGSANGQEWSEQRRFSVKTMKDTGLGRPKWEELVQEEVEETVKRIQSNCGQSIDASDTFASTFTNNILTMLFGQRFPYDDPAVKRLSHNMDFAMRESSSLGMSNFFPALSSILLKMGLWGSKEALSRIKEYTVYVQECVDKCLKKEDVVEEESFVKTYHQELQQNKKKNIINTLTDLSLYTNTHTLVLGGSETTRNAFLWLLVSVAEHPEKQELVHRELDRVLGKNGTIKWAERMRVPYTFATIMESMRWRTLVPISTLRMYSADTLTQGYNIPKGTAVLINNWALHNDPKYWNDPEKFEPERFLQEGGNSVNFKPDSYNPFSFGRRNCPGELIALTEILLYFATIMQKFTVLPEEGDTRVKVDTCLGLTYQPIGIRLRFLART